MMKRRGWEMKLVLFFMVLASMMVVFTGCGGQKQTSQQQVAKPPPAQEQPKEQEPAKKEETPTTEKDKTKETTPSTPTPTASTPQVVKVESFPENGYVLVGGSVAFHVQLKSAGSAITGFAA